MTGQEQPAAILAEDVPPRTRPSRYPEPFATRMGARTRRQLGDHFGLKSFGVNLTRLSPGARSALHHVHARQDEFVYVLDGELTLFTDAGSVVLTAGMIAGFPAAGTAHHLENLSDADCLYLEVGDRAEGDMVDYPQDDLLVAKGADGALSYAHKDGTPN